MDYLTVYSEKEEPKIEDIVKRNTGKILICQKKLKKPKRQSKQAKRTKNGQSGWNSCSKKNFLRSRQDGHWTRTGWETDQRKGHRQIWWIEQFQSREILEEERIEKQKKSSFWSSRRRTSSSWRDRSGKIWPWSRKPVQDSVLVWMPSLPTSFCRWKSASKLEELLIMSDVGVQVVVQT